MTIRAVLAEDQGLVLGAFASLLALERDIDVAATQRTATRAGCRRGAPARRGADRHRDARSHGLDVATGLQRRRLATRVVIVTTFARSGYLRRALDAGVAGYVLKDARVEQLVDALRRVHSGA